MVPHVRREIRSMSFWSAALLVPYLAMALYIWIQWAVVYQCGSSAPQYGCGAFFLYVVWPPTWLTASMGWTALVFCVMIGKQTAISRRGGWLTPLWGALLLGGIAGIAIIIILVVRVLVHPLVFDNRAGDLVLGSVLFFDIGPVVAIPAVLVAFVNALTSRIPAAERPPKRTAAHT